MLSTNIIQLATEFQQAYNLDPNTTKEAYIHDSIHAITGLGVSLEDEEIVLNITEVLQGGYCNPIYEERVINFIQLIDFSGYLPEIISNI